MRSHKDAAPKRPRATELRAAEKLQKQKAAEGALFD
jgi:hypothetical protein